jgi:hypothetical protein
MNSKRHRGCPVYLASIMSFIRPAQASGDDEGSQAEETTLEKKQLLESSEESAEADDDFSADDLLTKGAVDVDWRGVLWTTFRSQVKKRKRKRKLCLRICVLLCADAMVRIELAGCIAVPTGSDLGYAWRLVWRSRHVV